MLGVLDRTNATPLKEISVYELLNRPLDSGRLVINSNNINK